MTASKQGKKPIVLPVLMLLKHNDHCARTTLRMQQCFEHLTVTNSFLIRLKICSTIGKLHLVLEKQSTMQRQRSHESQKKTYNFHLQTSISFTISQISILTPTDSNSLHASSWIFLFAIGTVHYKIYDESNTELWCSVPMDTSIKHSHA